MVTDRVKEIWAWIIVLNNGVYKTAYLYLVRFIFVTILLFVIHKSLKKKLTF